MTISSASNQVRFQGNGIATAFPFSFKVFKAADLVALLTDATGLEQTLLNGPHYSISLNSNQDSSPGGVVTLLTAPAADEYLSLERRVEATQLTDITNQGGFYPQVIEDALDKLTMLAQQALAQLARGLSLPAGADPDTSAELPGPQGLALLGWDASGTQLVNYAAEELGVSIAMANWQTETFSSGEGGTSLFTLSNAPGVASNCDVTVSGVTQIAGIDFTLAGTNLTFTTPPPEGALIAVRYGQALANVSAAWGGVSGTLADQSDLQSALDAKASSTHSHVAANVSDFAEAVDDRIASLLVAGANISLTYNDASNTLTIAATGSGGVAWGSISGTLSSQSDLQTALNAKAPAASPTFTGTVTMPAGTALTNPSITNFTETRHTPAAGASFTVDLVNGTVQRFTTNANTTITLPASASGKSFVVEVAYGGAHSITWAGGGTLRWAGGSAPAATSVNGKIDRYVFACDGSNTFGSDGGRNF